MGFPKQPRVLSTLLLDLGVRCKGSSVHVPPCLSIPGCGVRLLHSEFGRVGVFSKTESLVEDQAAASSQNYRRGARMERGGVKKMRTIMLLPPHPPHQEKMPRREGILEALAVDPSAAAAVAKPRAGTRWAMRVTERSIWTTRKKTKNLDILHIGCKRAR